MALTPRRNELDAVTAILESDEFDSSADMAKALVKTIYAELGKRDGYGVAIGLRTDDLRIAHGPYATILDAKRVVKEAEARGLVAYIAPLLGAANALTEEEDSTYRRCTCGHPEALHGSAIKPKAITTLGCGTYHPRTKEKCPCRAYVAA